MTQTTAVAIRDEQDEFDDKQVSILRTLGVEKANRADLAMFFHVCKRTGLDPFARQIYMVERWTKDGPKQSVQTGIDGFRLVAQRTTQRTGEALGYEDTQWCGQDGIWRDVWLSQEPPAASRVVVLRNGQRFPAVALFHEYAQTKKGGDLTQMWATKGALMIAKCAEALALRKAFPMDLSDLYTADEMQGEGVGHRQPPRRQSPAPQFTKPAPETEQVTEGEVVAEPAQAETLPVDDAPDPRYWRKRMFATLNERGITDADEQRDGIAHIIGRDIESRSELTEADAEQVVQHLEATGGEQ